MGARLILGLKMLEQKYGCVGDVRSMGMYVWLQMINADGSEATEIRAYVKNRMRDNRM
ncbi:hypothetical protein SAMN05444358_11164 [Ruegeria halocynthiae]|uniref:Uncharacterized protein n=1 Tax=Ruegeria halocynthiae TaxID=985054 RepID=A0A1H3EH04_9RHOB|nr:hypothetical protein SAMN05444358_11164 [Ruegeria halocynthiae]